MNYNKLFIQNFKLIMVPNYENDPVDGLIFDAFIKEVNRKGFKLSEDLKNILLISDINTLNVVLDDLNSIDDLKDYKPLIKDFASTGNDEMIEFISKYKSEDESKLVELNVLNNEKIQELFSDLINSNSVWSIANRESIDALLSLMDHSEIQDILSSANLSIKENVSYLVMKLYVDPEFEVESIYSLLKTSTDVLRFAMELQGENLKSSFGTISFKFTNRDKRTILSLLNRDNMLLDMFRQEHNWKLIAGRINPMTKSNKAKYPKTYRNFNNLMNGNKPENWGRRANDILVNNDHYTTEDAIRVYSERPGEFSRSINALISRYDSEAIIDAFSAVSADVAPKALIELLNSSRTPNYSENRVSLIKNKFTLLDDSEFKIDPYNSDLIASVVESALMEQLSSKEEMGKILIDSNLFNIPVPIQERESSSGYQNLPKLSRIPIPEDVEVIRSFVRWFDGVDGDEYSRIDLDLSTIAYNSDFSNSLHCGWNVDFKHKQDDQDIEPMIYSGDKMSAPDGAIEFNDINLNGLKEKGLRYVVSDLRSYTGQLFCDINDASFGVQFNTNEIKTSLLEKSNFKAFTGLNNTSTNVTLFILDLEKREILFVNAPIDSENRVSNGYNPKFIEALMNLEKLSVGELLTLNVKARGGEMITQEEYDHLTDSEKEDVKIFNSPGSEEHEIENSKILANFL